MFAIQTILDLTVSTLYNVLNDFLSARQINTHVKAVSKHLFLFSRSKTLK